MKNLLLIIISLLFGILSCKNAEKETQNDKPAYNHAVIAYLSQGNRLIEPKSIAVEKLTHINYAFANIIDGKITEGQSNDPENFKRLNGLKQQNPKLKILISVGGWGWSGGFSDMASTYEKRRKFINSTIDFINSHELDGIDLDWEYPALTGNNNPHMPEDKENFTALLKELRDALDKNSEKTNQNYLLTIAAGAFPDYVNNIELEKIIIYLDFINLMTYDFAGGWDKETGHLTNLYVSILNPDGISTDKAIQYYIDKGAPANKLVLGIAFYGRGWTEVTPKNNGLFQIANGRGLEFSYFDIYNNSLNKNGFMSYYDSIAEAPYLWNDSSKTFISYENEKSIIAKCRYTEENKLFGIMFWEYNGDYQGQLLNTLNLNLNYK